ncbi:M28 family peptidase [Nocardia sp. NPDC127526]|uniref:M28 family peptidase n=1 Tax=Nocardia sp. NPDC127526 TaxID=3345393 RepID=UPI00363D8076
MRVGRGLSGFLAFAVLLLVAVATAWEQQPHGYEPESAPGTEFSAARAARTVQEIAQRPHPVGTAEHDRVRDYLAATLRELGLETEIRSGIGKWPGAFGTDSVGVGRVDNIVARIPGTNPTGTVYLVAHYDSVPSGPGANDDGVGVAAIVETVRALRAGETGLRNNVVALLTDGEEMGLLGAEAFVSSGDFDRNGVIINLEARGAGGPAMLWRITHPDSGLIDVVRKVAPHPNTDSMNTQLATGEQTGSNTDFAAFEPAGLRVLDWAYAGHSAYYHNRLDDPDHVNPATMQQMGDNTLAQAREFGQRDLADTAGDTDLAYFALPFGVLVTVPPWVLIALAVVMVVLVGWVVWQVRRHGEASIKRVLGSAVVAFLAIPAAVGAAYGMWRAVELIRPEYAVPIDPYRPGFFQAAMIMAAVFALLAWYALARRVFGPTATPVGLLVCVSVLGALLAALLPAAAHILVVPALAAAIGVTLTFLIPDAWRLPVLTVFLLPAALFLGSSWSGLQVGLNTGYLLLAPMVVLYGGLLLFPLTHAWPRRHGWTIPALALLLTAALTAAGLAVNRVDAQHPRMAQLYYALDADRNAAQWISAPEPNPWTEQFVSANAPEGTAAEIFPKAKSSGPAPAQALSPPTAQILSDRTEAGQRTVRLLLRSPRGATRLDLRWAQNAIQALRVAGREIAPAPERGFRFFAPTAEGVEVELVASAGPLPLTLLDYSWLPDSGVAAHREPPADVYLMQGSAAVVYLSVPGL